MNENNTPLIDSNALLLQVMAHDLLAPLTAIKWQLELLAREGSTPKGADFIRNLQQSSDLGIVLTKRAHVAGRVLVGSYEPDASAQSLSEVIDQSIRSLVPQYERHGVSLDVSVDAEQGHRTFDKELVAVFIWSIAKFFLSCAPAQSKILVRGMSVSADSEGTYVVIVSARDIPDAQTCVETFKTGVARGAYDHAFVFARLVRDLARILGVDVSVDVQEGGIAMETIFRGPVTQPAS